MWKVMDISNFCDIQSRGTTEEFSKKMPQVVTCKPFSQFSQLI
jgi:hypothetical protein